MVLKYYNSYLAVAPSSLQQKYFDDIQAVIDDQFENASDYFIIQKENSTTSVYENIGVRLTAPYLMKQMYTIKDDMRQILFKSNSVESALGDRYYFNNFYWLTVDTGRVETPTNSCQIERCNASLKFYDTDGNYQETPCIAMTKRIYDVKQNKEIWIPDNQMLVRIKYDSVSQKIGIDRRFLLNGLAWRVGSVDNLSYVRNEQGYVEMYFKSDFISPSDDLILGIADSLTEKATYTLQILNKPIPQITPLQVNKTDTLQLNINLIKKVNSISTIVTPFPDITFVSDTPLITTVSNSGLVEFLDVGVANISAKLSSDNTVLDSIQVEGISVVQDNFSIELIGDKQPDTEIKLSSSAYTTYTATLYNNGVVVPNSLFDFVLTQGIAPSSSFSYVVLNDYQVKIQCKQYVYNIVLNVYLRSNHSVMTQKTIKLRGVI